MSARQGVREGNVRVLGGVWPSVSNAARLAILAILLAACSAGASPSPSARPLDLQGAWLLVSGDGPNGAVPVVHGSRITMVVDGKQVSGQSACNHYGGTVAIAGDQVRFDGMAVTEMACAEPIMASEAAFWEAFAGVTAAVRDEDELTLGGPEVELRFELQPPVPVADLVDTEWLLDSLISGDAAQSVDGRPTLTLSSDGSLAATTGCRVLSGRYVVVGDVVDVPELAANGECEPALTAQNDHVLSVIEGGFTVRVDGQQLTLTGDSGLGLIYRATDP